MNALFDVADFKDPRTPRILAKTIYRELRSSGLSEKEVMSLAGELLTLLASDVRHQRPEHPAG